MKTYEINGTYGRSKNPCTVYVFEQSNGLKWYAAEDSCNVNATYDEIEEGCDIEELSDTDFFTWPKGINSLNDLEQAIEA